MAPITGVLGLIWFSGLMMPKNQFWSMLLLFLPQKQHYTKASFFTMTKIAVIQKCVFSTFTTQMEREQAVFEEQGNSFTVTSSLNFTDTTGQSLRFLNHSMWQEVWYCLEWLKIIKVHSWNWGYVLIPAFHNYINTTEGGGIERILWRQTISLLGLP